MGEVSGHVARAWHRRRRDQRLGYSALGLGAGGFVLVLVGTLLVTEVVPGLLDDDPPAQRVVPSSQLEPQEQPDGEGAPGAPAPVTVVAVEAAQPGSVQPAVGPAGGSGAGPSGGAPQPQPDPQPEPQPDPQPDPDPPGGQGPVGSLLDPVVQGVAGTADGVTGGATAPLTAPVTAVVDDVTDVVDGLLGAQ